MRSLLVRIVALLAQLIFLGFACHLMGQVIALLFALWHQRNEQLPLIEIVLSDPRGLPIPNEDA